MTTGRALVVLLLLTAASTNGQPATYTTTRDVEYARVGILSLRLDLYVPDGAGPYPLLVWIHGGGWSGGDKALNSGSPALKQATRGYVVASINYRLSDLAIFPSQIHDCKAAIRWLRSTADSWKVDPARIGAWGSSAGGHLVALLGTSGDVADLEGSVGVTGVSSRVQAVVDWYGPSDLVTMTSQAVAGCARVPPDDASSPESQLLGCAIPSCLETARRASPTTYVSTDDPRSRSPTERPIAPFRPGRARSSTTSSSPPGSLRL